MTFMPPYRVVVAERDDLLEQVEILRTEALNVHASHAAALAKIDNQRQALHDLDRQCVAYRATIDDMRQQLIEAKAQKSTVHSGSMIVCYPATARVLSLVSAERDRQRQLWGDQTQSPARWLAILSEEFGEAAQLLCRHEWELDEHVEPIPSTVKGIITELIQVAAVAVQIVERIGGEHG